MALNLGSMFAWLSADTSGLDKAERRMGKFVRNTDKGFGKVSNAARAMGRVLGVAIGVETIRRAATLADEYKGIQSRIKNVTKELGTYEAVQKRLNSLSIDSGAGLEGSAKLFANINRGSSETGATQKQALQLTETLNKLGVISGANNEQMKNGMLQFGQAMAAGIVRAEEWNSIMENIPEVGVRIANGLGMSVGQLRLMILDGKVFSKDVFAALLKQSEGINAEFAEMPKRMGQGFEAAKTGSMIFLAQLDQQLGLTTGIGLAFQSIGQYLSGDFSTHMFSIYNYGMRIVDSLGDWETIMHNIKGIYASIGGDAATFNQSVGYANTVFGFIGDSLVKMGANIRLLTTFTKLWVAEFLINGKQALQNFQMGFKMLWELVKMWGADAAAFISGAFTGVIEGLLGGIQSAMTGIGKAASFVGLDKMSKSLDSANKGMESAKVHVKGVAEEWQKTAEKSAAAIDKLTKKQEEQKDTTKGMLDLLDDEKDAAVGLYEEEIKWMNSAAKERERIFKEKQAQRGADEAAAKAAFDAEQAREAADPAVKTKSKGRSGSSKGSVAKEKIDNTLREAQQRFAALEQSLMSELDLEQRYHQESLDSLNQAEALQLDSIIPFHELRERLERDHQEALMAIERERLDKRLSAWGNFFGNLSSLQESESKKMAAIGKAAAMTQVLIDTARAAMSSYAYGASIGGPYLGLAFAAAAGVAGGAQLAAIRSAKATGGEVGMGGAYRVNEQGPEMLSTGGQDFLMMGSQGGHITPNSDIGKGSGGGVEIKVNVINLPGQTATVEKNGEREITIRMAVNQTKQEITSEARTGNGVVVPAILAAGGLKRKAS